MVNTDTILDWLRERVEAKQPIPQEAWADAGFKLNILLAGEHEEMERLHSVVSNKKLGIMQAQEKRNVAAADLEISASDDYRLMKLQEHRVARIEEFIKLAKKQMSAY